MADDLEARLESHAQAFEGLLSLIPAKDYYGVDNSDQWQRKKQTKEQKRAAKRAKLNPENQKSAKDVMDENEKKRKRELGIESDAEDGDVDMDSDVEKEVPGEGLRTNKKQKTDAAATANDSNDQEAKRRAAKLEKRKEKRQLKKEKDEKIKQKLEAKKARKQEQDLNEIQQETAKDDDEEASDDEPEDNADADAMDFSGLVDPEAPEEEPSAATSPDNESSVFDASANASAASSASSAPSDAPKKSSDADGTLKTKKEKVLKLPEVDQEELQARLRARIEELRARRKADGPNGQPARSRQDLLDARRKKEEARKAHKKELRLKAKQDEERANNERLRGSGSPLSTDIFSPRPIDENNFSFGRVAFANGQEADSSLSSIVEHKKRKGPQDTRTALAAAEKKAARLASLDDTKRADIQEKDAWLNAKKRAHGERVRDDTNLLKKTLKRKEKYKTKSATEWNERIENVKKGKEMKQKKREDNLAKRREEKGAKKGGKKAGGGKKKGRPGFEGRFKG